MSLTTQAYKIQILASFLIKERSVTCKIFLKLWLITVVEEREKSSTNIFRPSSAIPSMKGCYILLYISPFKIYVKVEEVEVMTKGEGIEKGEGENFHDC